jgi:ribosomal protein L37AE/L43A
MSQAIQLTQSEPASLARVTDQLAIDEVVARVQKVQEVQRRIMKQDVHYGKIPGTPKPTLYKPGAELLGMTFRLDPQFEIVERIRDGDHLTIEVRCILYHAPSGARMGSGLGSCSTKESKYAWRKADRSCPQCGKQTIRKSKEEGWYCWRKIDGCGAQFAAKDPAIVGQATGRVPNEDVADQHNTVLKMACKRAHVAAILFVTCASEIFTQDVEDMPRGGNSAAHAIMGEDDPDRDESVNPFPQLEKRLLDLEQAIATCPDYDTALKLRAELGGKGHKQSPLGREIQEAGPINRLITADQFKALGKIQNRCDRQLAKREKELAPGPEASFVDADDYEGREPGED